MFTKQYWMGENGVLVRAIRTFAQTFISVVGVSQFSLFSADWQNVLGISLGAALVSVFMSLDRYTPGVSAPVDPAPQPEEDVMQLGPLGTSR